MDRESALRAASNIWLLQLQLLPDHHVNGAIAGFSVAVLAFPAYALGLLLLLRRLAPPGIPTTQTSPGFDLVGQVGARATITGKHVERRFL